MWSEPAVTPAPARSDRAEQLQWLLVMAGEMLWLIAWSGVVGHWLATSGGGPLLPAWAVIGLVAVSAGLSRWLGQRRTGPVARLALALAGVALTALSGLSTVANAEGIDWAQAARWLTTGDLTVRTVATMGLTLLAWWRGLVLGQLLLSLDEVEGAFRRAVGALAILALLNAVMPTGRAPSAMLIWPAIGVLATGLLSLPLSRLIDVRLAAQRTGGPGVRLDRQWLSLLLITIGVLIAGALVVVSIVSFERLDTLFGWLRQPLDLLIDVFLAIFVLPVAYLLDLLVTFLRQFIQPNQPVEQESGVGDRTQPPLTFVVPPDLEWIFVLLRGLLALGLVVGIIGFLAAALLRFTASNRPDDVDEERDFVFSWPQTRAALWAWLAAWLARLRPAPTTSVAPARSATAAPPRAQWGPRDLYRALLRLGAMAGRPRALVETPNEYAGVLGGVEALNANQAAIEAITGLYTQAEYANDAPSADTVAAGQASLATLEAAMAEQAATVAGDRPADQVDASSPDRGEAGGR